MTRAERLARAAELQQLVAAGRLSNSPSVQARIRWLRTGPGSADYRTVNREETPTCPDPCSSSSRRTWPTTRAWCPTWSASCALMVNRSICMR